MKDHQPKADVSPYSTTFSRRGVLQAGGLWVASALLESCATPEQKIEWKSFSSQNFPYSTEYPTSWTTTVFRAGDEKIDLFLPNARNFPKLNIGIAAIAKDSKMSIEEYVSTLMKEESATISLIDPENKLILISTPDTKDDNGFNRVANSYPAFHLEFDFPDAIPEHQKRHKVVFTTGSHIWEAVLHGYSQEVQKNLPVFKRMLDSFQLRQSTI